MLPIVSKAWQSAAILYFHRSSLQNQLFIFHNSIMYIWLLQIEHWADLYRKLLFFPHVTLLINSTKIIQHDLKPIANYGFKTKFQLSDLLFDYNLKTLKTMTPALIFIHIYRIFFFLGFHHCIYAPVAVIAALILTLVRVIELFRDMIFFQITCKVNTRKRGFDRRMSVRNLGDLV